jgi:enoyl-[acyl-carrier protein] reductase I
MSFLNVTGKTFLITGVANKKSVAFHSAKILQEEGANLIFTVQHLDAHDKVSKLFPGCAIYILDVESDESFEQVDMKLSQSETRLDGLLHSIAFANLLEPKPFHETSWADYAQAERISCFSLTKMAHTFKEHFNDDASVVTVSISDTKATSYGFLGPIKAALDATVPFLAKSFSEFSRVRFNAVCAGPLKTSASSGIPGYINNYLYAEQLTLRKQALKTTEVANSIVFLLSSASSGINGSCMSVDAGIDCNYFDQKIVNTVADNL